MKAKYSIRLLMYLARHRGAGPISTNTLVKIEKTPPKFTETILVELRKAGFLESSIGKTGGYVMAREPASITIGEVVRLMHGSTALVPCVSRTEYQPCEDCENEQACKIRRAMKKIEDSTAQILRETTFQDMLE
jgi:Rrf2 family protein